MKLISPRYSFRSRLLLLAIGVELVMLTLLVANSIRLQHEAMSDQTRWQVQQMMPVLNAALMAPLAQRDFATIQAILDESRATEGIEYVVVVDRNNHTVASSGWKNGEKLPEPSRKLPLFTLNTTLRYDDILPIEQSGQRLGNLHLGLDLSRIISARRTLLIQGIGIAAVELALSSLILLLIGYWLTRHLTALTEASLQVASGNLTPPPLHEGDDDIGQLGKAFNTMSLVIADRVHDLTQAKEVAEASERAKSESEEQLKLVLEQIRLLLNSTAEAIYGIDLEGNCTFANPSFLRMLGYTDLQQLIGVNMHRLIHHSYPDGSEMPVEECCIYRSFSTRTGTHHDDEFLWRADGTSFPVEYWSHPQILNDEVIGAVVTFYDISERKQAREQLAVKQLELEALNRSLQQQVDETVAKLRQTDQMLISQGRQAAMGEMIGNIAHQWRQPLNALSMLISNIQFAQMDNELTTEYMEGSAATANRLIQKMSTTINDFRNFFSPDKEMTAFPALQQIRNAVGLVDAAFKSSNISIVVNSEQECTLKGFPNEYSQVLLNLLSNAKEAIQSSGTLPGLITITLEQQGETGVVKIRDTGGGIPDTVLDKIFEPYFSTKSMGTGIGLYMSKMIIERNMDGAISAQTVDGGAEFIVSIPLAEGRS